MYRPASVFMALALLTIAIPQADCSPATPTPNVTPDSATLVTMLGRDTVVLESYTRTPSRIEGRIVVRVPGTVLIHYVLDRDASGAPARSLFDVMPLGTSQVFARRVTIDFRNDTAFVDADSAGHHRRSQVVVPSQILPQLVTGFGSSYGLYESPVFAGLYAPIASASVGDTVHLTTLDIGSGRSSKRIFIKRSPTLLDTDFFGVAWTHINLDSSGRIAGVDASETTERTLTRRTAFADVPADAKRFAAADKAGKGLGAASPPVIERGTVDGAPVVVTYSSPRLRGRTVLGTVVPYGEVWRTGANEATTLFSDKSLKIGGTTLAPGVYTIWTLPRSDGTVDLIVNSQHGQWGTDHDGQRDIARIPMTVTRAASPAEDFAINITDTANASLRISWDTFIWTVPIALVK